jgi:hypothetical protein
MSWGHALVVGFFGSQRDAAGKPELVLVRPFTEDELRRVEAEVLARFARPYDAAADLNPDGALAVPDTMPIALGRPCAAQVALVAHDAFRTLAIRFVAGGPRLYIRDDLEVEIRTFLDREAERERIHAIADGGEQIAAFVARFTGPNDHKRLFFPDRALIAPRAEIVAPLTTLLEHREREVRKLAWLLLGACGPLAIAALPALRALGDPDAAAAIAAIEVPA